MAIFPNLRSLCSNLGGIDPEKLYRATLTRSSRGSTKSFSSVNVKSVRERWLKMSMRAKFLNQNFVADFKCFTATETRLSSDLWGSMGSCTPLPGFLKPSLHNYQHHLDRFCDLPPKIKPSYVRIHFCLKRGFLSFQNKHASVHCVYESFWPVCTRENAMVTEMVQYSTEVLLTLHKAFKVNLQFMKKKGK